MNKIGTWKIKSMKLPGISKLVESNEGKFTQFQKTEIKFVIMQKWNHSPSL